METSPDRTKRSGGHARSGPLLRPRDADAAPPQHRAPDARVREGSRARSRGPRPVVLAAGGALAVAMLVGAASVLMDGDDASPSAPAAGARPSALAASPGTTTGPDGGVPPAVLAATGSSRTPADARAALQELLTVRADGNLLLLRGTWEGDEAVATQGARAVATSSAGLSAVLAAWRDTDLARRISAGLDEQSEASRAYAAAVASDDVEGADEARGRMGEVSRALGDVLSGVTDDRIADYVPPQDAAQYRAFVDSLEAGDAARVEEVADWVRGRLSREGAALAAGVAGGGPS